MKSINNINQNLIWIENYSRILERRRAGTPPATLLDYFPENFLTIIDESHETLPQIKGMSNGDAARKQVLVDYGFRIIEERKKFTVRCSSDRSLY